MLNRTDYNKTILLPLLPMKLFWHILSVYLVSLAVLPCSDKEECDITVTEQTIISLAANHTQHSHQNEQCPPFCSCACCGIHSFQLQMSFINFKEHTFLSNKKKQISTYAFIYSNEFSSNIWQPPKLG